MFKKTLLGSLIAIGSLGVAQAEISGSTNFKVTIPEILVLYHWDQAHLTLTAGNKVVNDELTTHTKTEALDATTHTINADGYTAATATAPTKYANLTKDITVVLENSWAVRAITDKATVDVSVKKQNGDFLFHGGADTATEKIALGVPGLRKAGDTGTGTATLSVPSKWEPTIGDMVFTINLANATKSGDYFSPGSSFDVARINRDKDTFLLTLKPTP